MALRCNRRGDVGRLAGSLVAGVLVGVGCAVVIGASVVGRSANVLALHQGVRGGGVAQSFARTSPLPLVCPWSAKCLSTSAAPAVAFVAHHKSGTALMARILNETASLLGRPTYKQVMMGGRCRPDVFTLFHDADKRTFEEMAARCPSLCGVHVVRRPSAMLVSDYIYLRKLHARPWAEKRRQALGQELRDNGSVEWGLEKVCHTHANLQSKGGTADDMLAVHTAVRKSPRILEVKFEELGTEFDRWTRAIFEHLFGMGSPCIDRLVSRASKHDLARMSRKRMSALWTHVSNTTETKRVSAVLQNMFRRGASACLQRVKQIETGLGYQWDLGVV